MKQSQRMLQICFQLKCIRLKVIESSIISIYCGSFLLFMFHVCLCYSVLSVPCSHMITCWRRADLLALLCIMFSCVFVTFLCGVPGQVWYLVVFIPDLCPSSLLLSSMERHLEQCTIFGTYCISEQLRLAFNTFLQLFFINSIIQEQSVRFIMS